jgi:hypothetical protein
MYKQISQCIERQPRETSPTPVSFCEVKVEEIRRN